MPDAPTDAIIEDGDYSSYAAVGIKTDYVAAVGLDLAYLNPSNKLQFDYENGQETLDKVLINFSL